MKKETKRKWCPRCIEDWTDVSKINKGSLEPSDCCECGICINCEHLLECSKSK